MLRPYLVLLRPYLVLGASLRVYRPRLAGGGGGAGGVGSGVSLFQTSSAMSHFPFCSVHRTMYLPESAAGVPGGSFAPAGKVQFQRPVSTATGPLATTVTARRVSVGRGSIALMVAKNARIASLPLIVAMFGGMTTPSAA